MTNKQFWDIIDACNRKFVNFNQKSYTKHLKKLLSSLKDEEIADFYNIYSFYIDGLYRDDLWLWMIDNTYNFCDDSFEYFRRWIVSQGHDIYFNCFKDFNLLKQYSKPVSMFFESVLHVPFEILKDRYLNKYVDTDKSKEEIESSAYNFITFHIIPTETELEIKEELKVLPEDTAYGPIKKYDEDIKNEVDNGLLNVNYSFFPKSDISTWPKLSQQIYWTMQKAMIDYKKIKEKERNRTSGKF